MLPLSPHDATKLLLKRLNSRRMRDIVEKRYGLKGGRKKTLEAIGREYRITRERVRQIEADALKDLKKEAVLSSQLKAVFASLEGYLRKNGGVMAESAFYAGLVGDGSSLSDTRQYNHLALLTEVGEAFHYAKEDNNFHSRWYLDRESLEKSEKIVGGVISALEEKTRPVTWEELSLIFSTKAQDALGSFPTADVMRAYLGTSKLIHKNPYGEYGLSDWSLVNPRGVRDKAYVVLLKSGKPLHFRDVAKAIDEVGWSKKKTNPQTVHNELIRNPSFVLVGRGLYALREWGYEPGMVRDIIVSVLKEKGVPLERNEIVRLVSERRFIKPQTVVLNLQNKSLFRRTADGKYTLV